MAVGQARPTPAIGESASPATLAKLVHALAQLPDDIELEVGCDEAGMGHLKLVASAYGVDERIAMVPSARAWATWIRGEERMPSDPTKTLAETVEGLWPPEVEARVGHADDHVLQGHRVAVVSNLPTQYRAPLFAAISRRLEAVGGSLRILFLRSSDGARTWLCPDGELEFDHEFVRGADLPIRSRPPRIPIGLTAALRRYSPTIVVSAGLSPVVSGRARRYARTAGIPFGLWSGEIATIAAAHGRVRQFQRRRLVQHSDFAIAYSALAAEYVEALSPGLPTVHGRNSSVENVSGRSRPDRPKPVELLAVGDLASRRKGIDVLVHALRAVPDLPARLTVVGGGRLQSDLENEASADRRVRFVGPLTGRALDMAYAESDILLFPSRQEVFGLALTEAMSHGVSPIISTAVGAIQDIAVPGLNCLVVDSHDPAAWSAATSRLVHDHALRSELGEAARRTIARRWTITHSVDGWIAGFRLGAMAGVGLRR